MSMKDQRCHNDEFWDSALGGCESCAIPCTDRNPVDCIKFCPDYGRSSTLASVMTPEPPVTPDSPASPWLITGLVVTTAILLCVALVLGRIVLIRRQLIIKDAEGNSGTIELLSDAQRNPDHTYNLPADERRLLETRTGIDIARVFCGLDTEHRSITPSETHIGPTTGVTPPLNHTPGNGTSVTSHDNQAFANCRPPTSVTSHDNQASSNGTSVTSHDNQASGNGTSVTSHDNQASGNGRPSSTSVTSHDTQASVNVGLPNRVMAHDHHENAIPGVPTSRTPYDSQGVTSSVPPVTPARNQGTASGETPNLGELAQNPASDHVVLPTSRPGDFGMSQDPTPMNPVSSLRESRGLIQNPVQATSGPPSDIPGSGIPSLNLQVYGAFPPEVEDRWNDLSLHSGHEGNLNLVSDEEDLDPLSGDPGSLQLDLRSGIEYAPEPHAADNMDHWVVVEQMSGTGGVSTGAVLRGCERIEEHAIHMPWVRGCFKTGHKLGIYTERGERSEEAMRQQALDVTGLPRQALVLSHQHWLNHPAPGPGPYPPQESIDSLFGDSGPA